MEVPEDLIEQLVDEWDIIENQGYYSYDRIDEASINIGSVIGTLHNILKSQSTEQE